MKGLLIEDDPAKANKILLMLGGTFPRIEIVLQSSYQNGLDAIFNHEFDFILLDMSLPTYDQSNGNFSGRPMGFGGENILKEMRRYRRLSAVKVITQYKEFDGGKVSMAELDSRLKSSYPDLYHGYISYAQDRTEWVNQLENFISGLNK